MSSPDKESYLINEASAVQAPFLGIAAFIILLALIFVFVKLPTLIEKTSNQGYGALLRNKSLMMGALGILVYVGAEVAIGSYLVNYFMDMKMPALIAENSFMQ